MYAVILLINLMCELNNLNKPQFDTVFIDSGGANPALL